MKVVEIFLAGLGVGLSLIVAIGAQNAYVMRQGIRREGVLTVVLICILSDVLLIGLGTAGMGAFIGEHERVLLLVTWAGVAYLVWFAIRAFRSAASPGALRVEDAAPSRGTVSGTTLAMTYLNPQVYLDTVVMLGSIAARYGGARWVFASGAVSASVVWFIGLGAAAAALAGPLGKPRTWRIIDVGVGAIVLLVAVRMAVSGMG